MSLLFIDQFPGFCPIETQTDPTSIFDPNQPPAQILYIGGYSLEQAMHIFWKVKTFTVSGSSTFTDSVGDSYITNAVNPPTGEQDFPGYVNPYGKETMREIIHCNGAWRLQALISGGEDFSNFGWGSFSKYDEPLPPVYKYNNEYYIRFNGYLGKIMWANPGTPEQTDSTSSGTLTINLAGVTKTTSSSRNFSQSANTDVTGFLTITEGGQRSPV